MEDVNNTVPSWEAITEAFEQAHPRLRGQEPACYHPFIPWSLGGDSPLDTIVVYDAEDYYYFLTCGFSEPFSQPVEGREESGYGFELTVRLKKAPLKDAEKEKRGMAGILQSLAALTFGEGEIYQPFEYIYTGQQTGLDAEAASKLTGFVTIPDSAGKINTPDGTVQFVQLIGMTDGELQAVMNQEFTVSQLVQRLGQTLTDYGRQEIDLRKEKL